MYATKPGKAIKNLLTTPFRHKQKDSNNLLNSEVKEEVKDDYFVTSLEPSEPNYASNSVNFAMRYKSNESVESSESEADEEAKYHEISSLEEFVVDIKQIYQNIIIPDGISRESQVAIDILKCKENIGKLLDLIENTILLNIDKYKIITQKRGYRVFDDFTQDLLGSQHILLKIKEKIEQMQGLENIHDISIHCNSLNKLINSSMELLLLPVSNNETFVDKDLYYSDDNEKVQFARLKNWRRFLKNKDININNVHEFIEIYFEYLTKSKAKPIANHMVPSFIVKLIPPQGGFEVFKHFINKMFEVFASRIIPLEFFVDYLFSLKNMLCMDPSYISYFKDKTFDFILHNPHDSEKLNDGLAFFLKEYLYLGGKEEHVLKLFETYKFERQELSKDEQKDNIVQYKFSVKNAFAQFNKLVEIGNKVKNQQIHRYQCELVLKILKFMIDDINDSRDKKTPNVEAKIKTTMKNFVKTIEFTKVIHLLVFKDWFTMANSDFYIMERFRENVIDNLADDRTKGWLNTCNYDKKRSEYAVLHPLVRLIADEKCFNIDDYYHEILWAMFDYFEKHGFKDDTKAEFKMLKDNLIVEQQLTLKEIDTCINKRGLNISSKSNNFFREIIIAELGDRIFNAAGLMSISNVLLRTNNGLNILKESIKFLLPKPIDLVDYSLIRKEHIKCIMEDNIKDENLLCGLTHNEFLEIILSITGDFSERFVLLTEFIKGIKPRFDKTIIANSNEVEFFKDKTKREEFFKAIYPANGNLEEVKGSPYEVIDALGKLNLDLLKDFLCRLENSVPEEKYKLTKSFIVSFDALVEREVSNYKFTLPDMHKYLNQINNDRRSTLGRLGDLQEFSNMLDSRYKSDLSLIKPNGIKRFERNQTLAIYLATQRFNQKYSFFKIATGNGKTVVEAMTALEYLRIYPKNKVVILSAFRHLCVRDQENMEGLFKKHNIESCVVDSVDDVLQNWSSKTSILYASIKFINLMSDCASRINESPKLSEFIRMIYSLKNQLVIIDEFDIILDVSENHYIHNGFKLFNQGPNEVKNTLKSGAYQQAASIAKVNIDLDEMREAGAVQRRRDGSTYVTAEGMGRQLTKHILLLKFSVFSLKGFFADNNVIGFSGSVHKKSMVQANYRNRFDGISENNLIDIPLFFAPESIINPNIKAITIKVDSRQLGDFKFEDIIIENELLNLSRSDALESREAWVEAIKQDIQKVQSLKNADDVPSPVMIFVNNKDTQVDKDDFQALVDGLGIKKSSIYEEDTDTKDDNLQKIASPGAISLCTKKVGRGADVRIPQTISRGLHVIVARPDYAAELIQEIGRTGRMNRPGSFSLIFHKEQNVPSYGENDLDSLNKASFFHSLSRKFYQKDNLNQSQVTLFAWLLLCTDSGRWTEIREVVEKFVEEI